MPCPRAPRVVTMYIAAAESLSFSVSLSLSLSLLVLSFSLVLSRSLSLPHSFSRSLSLSRSFSLPPFLSLSLPRNISHQTGAGAGCLDSRVSCSKWQPSECVVGVEVLEEPQ